MLSTLSNPPPDPPGKRANLYERLDYLVRVGVFLVIEALSTRHNTEQLMADLTAITQALADFKVEVATHATKIDTQLQQLLDAQGSGDQDAIDALAAEIRNETSALQALDVKLDADDPAATG